MKVIISSITALEGDKKVSMALKILGISLTLMAICWALSSVMQYFDVYSNLFYSVIFFAAFTAILSSAISFVALLFFVIRRLYRRVK